MSHTQPLDSGPRYRYMPLANASEIRLLKLLPERKDNLLVCLLEHFSPEQGKKSPNQAYMSLSYVWGNTKMPMRPIKLGNSKDGILYDHEVHENIWQLLDSFQSVPGMCDSLYWTDCLCLDQDCQSEKDQQIPRMKDIYSNAFQTMAWLGRDQGERIPESHTTFETLFNQIEGWIKREKRPSIEAQIRHALRNIPGKWEKFGREPSSMFCDLVKWPDDVDLPLMTQFFTTTYWTRVWIVQEVALSRDVVFIWGTHHLPLDDLLLAYKVYMINSVSLKNLGFHQIYPANGRGIQGIPAIEAKLSIKDLDPEDSVSVLDILAWVEVCHSSKAVDRIYGLLGLLFHGWQDSASWIERLAVDSNKGEEMVLWDFVLEIPVFTKQMTEIMDSLSRSLGCSNWSVRALEALMDDPKFSPRHRDLAQTTINFFWGLIGVFRWIDIPDRERPSRSRETAVAKIAALLIENDDGQIEPEATTRTQTPIEAKCLWRCGAHRLHRALESTVLVSYEASYRANGPACCLKGKDCEDGFMYLENDNPECWFKCKSKGWGALILETAGLLDAADRTWVSAPQVNITAGSSGASISY